MVGGFPARHRQPAELAPRPRRRRTHANRKGTPGRCPQPGREPNTPRQKSVAIRSALPSGGESANRRRKLALIYAISEDHSVPRIDAPAVQWASQFVLHQTRRMLYMASLHVSDSEFDHRCKRLLELLLEWRARSGNPWMPYREITRRLRWSRRNTTTSAHALIDQERIATYDERTGGRPRLMYRAL